MTHRSRTRRYGYLGMVEVADRRLMVAARLLIARKTGVSAAAM